MHMPRVCLFAVVVSLAACGGPEPVDMPGDMPYPDELAATVSGATSPTPALTPLRSGIATYYDATGEGNCSFDASPNDLDVAALNAPEYGTSQMCGACAWVEGPQGSVLVRIVDKCPECAAGHLDLSKQAFAKISPLVAGRVDIRWQFVSCPVTGNVRYRYKEGSSQWWTAIQVRNHRLPVSKLEYLRGTTWTPVQRLDYNYFVEPKGMGTGQLRVRITDSKGRVLEDTLPAVSAGRVFDGKSQFPLP